MPWFKVDDGFWSHPKTLQLSDGAQALWMRAGSWSMHQLTDGFIPDFALPILSAKPRHVDELRAVSLWFSVKDGNQFHDWDKYQPTREQVEADRRDAAERKRRSREKSQRQSRVTAGEVTVVDTPTPTRPDPTRPTTSNEVVKERPANRGSRLSEDWLPSAESIAKAREDAPDVDAKAEHSAFIDYWIAQPGQKGVKTNWDATWRNWMRRKQADVKRPGTKTPTTKADQNAALYQQLYGGDHERTRGFPALDPGVGA
jgi:hypothetical protein